MKIVGFDSHIGYVPFDRATNFKNPMFSSSVNNIANILLVFWQSAFFPPTSTLPFIATMRCQQISYENNNTKEGGIFTPTSMIKWSASCVIYQWWSNIINPKQTKHNAQIHGLQQKLHRAHTISLNWAINLKNLIFCSRCEHCCEQHTQFFGNLIWREPLELLRDLVVDIMKHFLLPQLVHGRFPVVVVVFLARKHLNRVFHHTILVLHARCYKTQELFEFRLFDCLSGCLLL